MSGNYFVYKAIIAFKRRVLDIHRARGQITGEAVSIVEPLKLHTIIS
jgi:hypothetical protein